MTKYNYRNDMEMRNTYVSIPLFLIYRLIITNICYNLHFVLSQQKKNHHKTYMQAFYTQILLTRQKQIETIP